jgi:hypothetical protein
MKYNFLIKYVEETGNLGKLALFIIIVLFNAWFFIFFAREFSIQKSKQLLKSKLIERFLGKYLRKLAQKPKFRKKREDEELLDAEEIEAPSMNISLRI